MLGEEVEPRWIQLEGGWGDVLGDDGRRLGRNMSPFGEWNRENFFSLPLFFSSNQSWGIFFSESGKSGRAETFFFFFFSAQNGRQPNSYWTGRTGRGDGFRSFRVTRVLTTWGVNPAG